MAPKAKSSGPSELLKGKHYKESVQELFSSTALRPADIDQKAVQLLDALQKAGKADAGCQHLKVSLEGIAREKVQNWRAYSYKLLRDFDSDVYNSMKAKAEGNRARGQGGKKAGAAGLNPNPVEFQPGQWWQGDHTKGSLQPSVPMGYPMNMMSMMMMPQMMPQQMAQMGGGGAPPPPPAKAAQMPKASAESKEAPAPEKPADATVPAEAKDAPAAESAPAAEA